MGHPRPAALSCLLTAAFAALLPAAAYAACPRADDLDSGVLFQLENGESETFRKLENGLIESVYSLSDGSASRVLLVKGLYVVEVIDLANGVPDSSTRTTYSYPGSPGDLPEPSPGETWTLKPAKMEGTGLSSETQVYTAGKMTEKTFGPCAYEMLPITVSYTDQPDLDQRDLLHYFPELGISYLAEFHDKDYDDVYSYVTIEVIE